MSRGGWALGLLVGCQSEAPLEASPAWRAPGDGQALIASDDRTALYAADAPEGLVSRYDVASGAVQNLAVDGEPTRMVRVEGRILVTLRAERAIAVLEDRDGALTLVDRVETGAEPLGIVASADGERVYVALWGQDEVHELDGDLGLLRSFAVPGHPSWLALHPGGEALYVGCGIGGALTWIDTAEDAPTPADIAFPVLLGAGRQRIDPLTRRVTGDLSFSPAGDRLAVPTLWVDNLTVPGHHGDEEDRDPAEEYAAIGLGLSPTNPGVALVDVDARGHPTGDDVPVVYAVGYASIDSLDATQVVRSYLSTVSFSPDGAFVLAAMEGSRVVVALAAAPEGMTPGLGGFVDSPAAFIGTGTGPRGLAFVGDDRAFVYNFLDGSVADLDVAAARAGLETGAPSRVLAHPPVTLATPTLDPVVEAGRRLFHSAISPQMSTPAAGMSCATCHFEGRNDGLSWMEFDLVPRQTFSLAGPVSTTAPFTWNNDVATVAEEARITSQTRLGGRNVTDEELASVAAFIESTRDADHAERGSESAAVLRGRDLFARADVGCLDCHYGRRMTDNDTHTLYDLASANTPSLVGVAATAPYLHDGRAATLGDVLETTRTGAMGDTSTLSDVELADLEAYLRSL